MTSLHVCSKVFTPLILNTVLLSERSTAVCFCLVIVMQALYQMHVFWLYACVPSVELRGRCSHRTGACPAPACRSVTPWDSASPSRGILASRCSSCRTATCWRCWGRASGRLLRLWWAPPCWTLRRDWSTHAGLRSAQGVLVTEGADMTTH